LHLCADSQRSHSVISDLKFLGHYRPHCIGHFLSADRLHAAKIYWTLAEQTGAAFDVMPQDNVTIAEWPSQTRLSGTKNGDYWYAEQRSEVHCAGIIGKE